MAEGLATADGTAIDLDAAEREFSRAMAAPEPDEPEHAAPPKRVELSEEELGAKFGWITNPDGTKRAKRAKVRPSTKPRVTDAPPASEKPGKPKGQAETKPDLTQPLSELASAAWMVMAAVPIPQEPLRIKIRAQAAVLKSQGQGLVAGLNVMAQHNGMIRRGVEMMTMGSAGWVLPAVMAVAPFCVQSAQLWKMDPSQLAGVAAQTEAEWAAQFEAMQAEMSLQVAEPDDEREFYEQAAA